jgi:hypothetical protein
VGVPYALWLIQQVPSPHCNFLGIQHLKKCVFSVIIILFLFFERSSFFVNATMFTNARAFLRVRRTPERDIPIL